MGAINVGAIVAVLAFAQVEASARCARNGPSVVGF
jgi:hypothetical protein